MFLFGCLRACASSNSESRRASRALGAARPSYLSAAISMWMLQLFGCGIFPHTGSYQSRLTGHCLHSITERPGLEKKKILTSDRCPAWNHAVRSTPPLLSTPLSTHQKSPQFPLLPGMNKSVQLPCFTPGSPSPILYRSNITPAKRKKKKKAKPVPSKLTGRHNRMINHLRIYYLPVAYRCVWKMVQIVSISY